MDFIIGEDIKDACNNSSRTAEPRSRGSGNGRTDPREHVVREVFGRQRRGKNSEMIDYVTAIDPVQFSSKSELSSRFFGRLKFSALFE